MLLCLLHTQSTLTLLNHFHNTIEGGKLRNPSVHNFICTSSILLLFALAQSAVCAGTSGGEKKYHPSPPSSACPRSSPMWQSSPSKHSSKLEFMSAAKDKLCRCNSQNFKRLDFHRHVIIAGLLEGLHITRALLWLGQPAMAGIFSLVGTVQWKKRLQDC
jgi:hypothetical protein